ncbi:hypothetical protein BDV26DRAFT_257507 [Aspergillus bertholletiae]|uniref:Uncharacterized protein n=1 Tax=Aspergillus bertholletiae TaxID=1226010 RepID=A0A5N7BEY4_9EURO|nr:hypothetical protein BDV26DRAFT_257507 [Aspergillus bertholletiae]
MRICTAWIELNQHCVDQVADLCLILRGLLYLLCFTALATASLPKAATQEAESTDAKLHVPSDPMALPRAV